jgi:hypothetical protein
MQCSDDLQRSGDPRVYKSPVVHRKARENILKSTRASLILTGVFTKWWLDVEGLRSFNLTRSSSNTTDKISWVGWSR